ncbi:MAG TPA: histidinol dehydrogenase [Dongiaceae bacterium]|nr:histidinol dehydrogenase [Dongiaceae bacterium]
MRILSGTSAIKMVERLARRGTSLIALEPRVRSIINHVRRNGDRALRGYAQQWDGLTKNQPLQVSEEELKAAWDTLPTATRRSLRKAARNIRRFSQWQKPRSWTRTQRGISLGQLAIPVDSVGCYVPGGRYPLVSTLLMTVIPAQVAGVKNIRVVSPRPSDEVLAAAAMLGVREFYRIGGAQAIAALAYGTKSISRVDKIVGPGNAYVTTAKKLVAFDCSIDFLAGPTETVVLSESGEPDFIAADLVSQAEHDGDALSVFITTSAKLAKAVALSVRALSHSNATAKQSLDRHGAILIAASREQARDWANIIAPEHITITREDLPYISSAGSVFIGEYSPQAAGDYASGPNHVLPTAGQARFRGGLSVLDFIKLVTVQELSRTGLQQIAPTLESLARLEGLSAHANSVRVRCSHA